MKKNPPTSFASLCYKTLKKVPKGKVTTYQALADAMGTKAVRAVGTALAKNPCAPEVPCHRVVRSDGSVGQYAYGQKKKIRMLEEEGVEIDKKTVVELKRHLYQFKSGKT